MSKGLTLVLSDIFDAMYEGFLNIRDVYWDSGEIIHPEMFVTEEDVADQVWHERLAEYHGRINVGTGFSEYTDLGAGVFEAANETCYEGSSEAWDGPIAWD